MHSIATMLFAFLAVANGLLVTPTANMAFRPAFQSRLRPILAAESSDSPGAPEEATPAAPQQEGGYQTFYDDETGADQPIVYKNADGTTTQKPEISNSMRDRLINESRGLGADPNQKSPFLLVFAGFGVFVILGALAVNM